MLDITHNSHGYRSHLHTLIIKLTKVCVNFCVVQTHTHDNAILRLTIKFYFIFPMSISKNANGNGSLISFHANVSLCGSLGGNNLSTNLCKLKRVKIEGAMSYWIDPLYGTPPIIMFDKKQLVEQYHICYKGPSLKCLKFGKDFEEVEIKAFWWEI